MTYLSELKPNILTRYILKESLFFFFISLIAFTGILLTVRILKFASLIINKGVEPKQIAIVFLSIVPTFLEFAVPLAALLGVMLAFARLSGDSEIIVMRASGISFKELLKPILIFGVLVTLFGLVISNYLKPVGFTRLSNTLFQIARTKSTAGLSARIFNKIGGLTLYTEQIDDATGALSNIVIDDRRNQGERKVVVAPRGTIESDPVTRRISFFLYDGYIHELIQGKYVLTEFNSNRLFLGSDELYDPEVVQRGRPAKEMLGTELRASLREYEPLKQSLEAGEVPHLDTLSPLLQSQLVAEPMTLDTVNKKALRIRIESALRTAMPFASLLLALVGLPLGIQPPRTQRTWGAGLSTIIGALAFVVYYMLLSLGIMLAENRVVTPILATWIPNTVAAIFAYLALRQMAAERWQSVSHGLELIGSRAIRLIKRG